MNTIPTRREQCIRELTAPGQPFEVGIASILGVDTGFFVNAPSSLRDIYAPRPGDDRTMPAALRACRCFAR